MNEWERLRTLLVEATPGPWHDLPHDWPGKAIPILTHDAAHTVAMAFNREHTKSDAALIVAAVNALPALLDVAEAARRVQREWDTFGPTGDSPTLAAHRALRSALARLEEATR